MPPVYFVFENRISSIAVPRPSVTIARLMPRVRTAGSAKSTPSGIVARTPMMAPTQNGMSCVEMSRPATHAPKPAIAYWASESCPV